MKQQIHTLIISILFILFIPVNFFAQDFKTVHDGVEYAEVNHKIGDDPVKINLLRLDLTKVRLDVHHAMDAAIGTEKTSSIATRHGAVAAINAGFFRLDTSIFAGDAAGILKIDQHVYSEPTDDRVALFIRDLENTTSVTIGHLRTNVYAEIRGRTFEITGTNRERKSDDLVEFTPKYHRTTLTQSRGVEVIVRKGKIVKVVNGTGSNTIPDNGFILSATGKAQENILKWVRVGNKVKRYTALHPGLNGERNISISAYGAQDIVGGVPQLIKNGRIAITWEEEKSSKAFVETRHPRTAVAKLKDGKFLMITVDGRQPGVSVGMNLNELAEYLLGLGAVDAMNFDGGGSTTMFLDGKVVNRPSDKEGERKVSDAILVTLRRKR